jgi:hypothetical protein
MSKEPITHDIFFHVAFPIGQSSYYCQYIGVFFLILIIWQSPEGFQLNILLSLQFASWTRTIL